MSAIAPNLNADTAEIITYRTGNALNAASPGEAEAAEAAESLSILIVESRSAAVVAAGSARVLGHLKKVHFNFITLKSDEKIEIYFYIIRLPQTDLVRKKPRAMTSPTDLDSASAASATPSVSNLAAMSHDRRVDELRQLIHECANATKWVWFALRNRDLEIFQRKYHPSMLLFNSDLVAAIFRAGDEFSELVNIEGLGSHYINHNLLPLLDDDPIAVSRVLKSVKEELDRERGFIRSVSDATLVAIDPVARGILLLLEINNGEQSCYTINSRSWYAQEYPDDFIEWDDDVHSENRQCKHIAYLYSILSSGPVSLPITATLKMLRSIHGPHMEEILRELDRHEVIDWGSVKTADPDSLVYLRKHCDPTVLVYIDRHIALVN